MGRLKRCSVLLMVSMLLGLTACSSTDVKDSTNEQVKDFQGSSFSAGDGSVIYFEKNGEFAWYLSDEDHDDNYYSGNYELYFGEDAEDFIVNSIPEFGVTQDELDKFMNQNEGDDLYKEENFCCMVLDNQEVTMEGALMDVEAFKSYYMGFYEDGYLDVANMSSANYYSFTKNK